MTITNLAIPKSVIIVTYYYPPIISVASNRLEAFAKYLALEGYQVQVVTCYQHYCSDYINNSSVLIHRLRDNGKIKKFIFKTHEPVIVRKAKSLFNRIFDLVFYYEHFGWQNYSIHFIRKLITEVGNCTVISSSAPHESHRIPLQLKIEGKPFIWIADFRDELSQNPYIPQQWKKRNIALESKIQQYANAIVSVSRPILNYFKHNHYPNGQIFKEIRNGFDFDYTDYPVRRKSNSFKICYTGIINAAIDLRPFFNALATFVGMNKDFLIQLELIGVGKSFPFPAFFKDNIRIIEKVPYKSTIKMLMDSDALLLLLPKDGRTGVFSGKLFDYLGSRKPIIALIDPTDVAADLIRETNTGYVADIDDDVEILKVLQSTFNRWREGMPIVFNDDIISCHHRKAQVKRLDCLINQLWYKNLAVKAAND